MIKCISKIVVFDLDETLGYYAEFGMFWDAIKDFIQKKELNINMDQDFFNKLMELFPEFIRPNIIKILQYLKEKKLENHCQKLMLYTNNQGPKEWSHFIVNYFESKLNHQEIKLFDQIVSAFKVNGKQVEVCRTSHMKTHKDLIRCTKIPEETQICYLDDVFYPGMKHKNIYYINVRPYIHDLPFQVLVKRLHESGIVTQTQTNMKEHLIEFLNTFNYKYVEKTQESYNIDKVISKKILQHLHFFFNKYQIQAKSVKNTNTSTRRNYQNRQNKNKTLKNY
jgi:hypothetical protein